MVRPFGNIDRSKMIPVRDFLTARKSASSWPYIGCLKKIWLGREIDREWFLSKRNTVRAEVVRKVVPSRKYGESLTDLEFAHLSPGSKPASRTARLRDERPCVHSLVSARDATRFCPRIEFCGCYCLTVACAHVYGDLGCFRDVNASEWNRDPRNDLLGNTADGGATCRWLLIYCVSIRNVRRIFQRWVIHVSLTRDNLFYCSWRELSRFFFFTADEVYRKDLTVRWFLFFSCFMYYFIIPVSFSALPILFRIRLQR